MTRIELPVDRIVPALLVDLESHRNLVLVAPTGSGKTTRVPPALWQALSGTVIVVEPRRIATRAAARRMAEEAGVRLGQEIGYRVRFDDQTSSSTRLMVVTEGILLRRLQQDPFLEGVDAVVFDEFHERSLQADLAAALCRQVQRDVREDLALVVMSATLDPEPVAEWLGDCVIHEAEGRTYPVDVQYLPHPRSDRIGERAAEGVRQMLDQTDQDILVFLPGVGEIRRTHRALGQVSGREILELYGALPPEKQDRVFDRGSTSRIILSTNVAETSITLPGIRAVVDTGLARVMRQDRGSGLDRLVMEPISVASADQRAGRAGRTGPGKCLRLWTEREQRARPDHADPEVTRVGLASAVLQLLAWGESSPADFPWLDPPPLDRVETAMALLEDLGLQSGGVLSERGRVCAGLPVHPRLGVLLVDGAERGAGSEAATAAAILSERDFLPRDRPTPRPSRSDVVDRVEALQNTRGGRAHHVRRVARQLSSHIRSVRGPRADDPEDALLRSLLAGWPDRVALRRGDGARLVGGRGVVQHRLSAVRSDLFLALDLDDRGTEAVVFLASGVEEDWLEIEEVSEHVWEDGKVRCMRQRRYRDLVLEAHPSQVDPVQAAEILYEAVRDDPPLPDDRELRALLLRIRRLGEWLETDLPDVDDLVDTVLRDLVVGRRSEAQLRKAPWKQTVLGRLPYKDKQLLDHEAPERIRVPSGSQIRVEYAEEGPPVLKVRIQELFGWTETPRIARGRVPVLLHLLAPNYRPQQITTDLANFWDETYEEVRKQLRARYPKHPWPEDPRTARAIRK